MEHGSLEIDHEAGRFCVVHIWDLEVNSNLHGRNTTSVLGIGLKAGTIPNSACDLGQITWPLGPPIFFFFSDVKRNDCCENSVICPAVLWPYLDLLMSQEPWSLARQFPNSFGGWLTYSWIFLTATLQMLHWTPFPGPKHQSGDF